jgi:hypothetical protein
MANEVNIQATLTVQRYTPALQGSGTKDLNQTGKSGISHVQNIGTASAETLTFGDVVATGSQGLGYVFVKNLDGTNFVELSLNDFTSIFAKLLAGQFCLIPFNKTQANSVIYAKANTAAVDVLVVAAEQ